MRVDFFDLAQVPVHHIRWNQQEEGLVGSLAFFSQQFYQPLMVVIVKVGDVNQLNAPELLSELLIVRLAEVQLAQAVLPAV